MTFDRLWALLLLILPLGWLLIEWRRSSRHRSLLLKVAMVVAVILALAEPRINFEERKVTLGVLLDTSASMTDADLARESALIKEMSGSKGSNRLEVVPFARGPRSWSSSESDRGLTRTAGAAGRATNLEAPIRHALAALPSGTIHRLVLVSDGNENDGAVTRAVWQAQQVGVAIDTIPLAGQQEPKLKTMAVGFPSTVFTGERFPVDLTISSPCDRECHCGVVGRGQGHRHARGSLAGR